MRVNINHVDSLISLEYNIKLHISICTYHVNAIRYYNSLQLNVIAIFENTNRCNDKKMYTNIKVSWFIIHLWGKKHTIYS